MILYKISINGEGFGIFGIMLNNVSITGGGFGGKETRSIMYSAAVAVAAQK